LRYIKAIEFPASSFELWMTPRGSSEPAEIQPMTQCQHVVLVVDDDWGVRESLKFALEVEGMRVRVCGSGAELLNHPDLTQARCLVLDYKMPKMDGFEVLDRLAARKTKIPVVLITSPITGAIRNRADRMGIECILEKPFLDRALVDAIHGILDCRPQI
jgi:two-component system, LuxR family, response regulator FixJ